MIQTKVPRSRWHAKETAIGAGGPAGPMEPPTSTGSSWSTSPRTSTQSQGSKKLALSEFLACRRNLHATIESSGQCLVEESDCHPSGIAFVFTPRARWSWSSMDSDHRSTSTVREGERMGWRALGEWRDEDGA